MRLYTVTFENQDCAASMDFFEVAPADDKPVAFYGLTLDNVGVAADAGDAQEELLRIAIVRGHSTTGSGGASPTAAPLAPSDTAAGFTAETCNTTIASAGTGVNVAAFGWNTRIPLREFWPQELLPICNQGTGVLMCVRLLSTPTDTFKVSGTLYVAELG